MTYPCVSSSYSCAIDVPSFIHYGPDIAGTVIADICFMWRR